MTLRSAPERSLLKSTIVVENSRSSLEHFWSRWKKEYRLELRESHHQAEYPPKENNCGMIAVGDVVLVHWLRGFLKLAKVENLIKGADGLTRGATVRVCSSDKQSTLMRCPFQLSNEVHQCSDTVDKHSNSILPVNKPSESTEADTNDSADGDQPNPTQVPHRQSRRIAARNAREIIQIQAEDM